MKPADFIQDVPNFHSMSGVDRILLVGWYLHTYRKRELFDNEAIRECFRQIHVEPPDVSVYLPRMAAKKPPSS
jgi:hypothetical protein